MKNIIKNTNKKGFTIVELVIVIAVIAILAGVLIPTFSSIITRANESAALQEAQAVYKEVYAKELVDNKGIITDGTKSGSAVNGTTYTFTLANGVLVSGTRSVTGKDGYYYTVENGVITAATKGTAPTEPSE